MSDAGAQLTEVVQLKRNSGGSGAPAQTLQGGQMVSREPHKLENRVRFPALLPETGRRSHVRRIGNPHLPLRADACLGFAAPIEIEAERMRLEWVQDVLDFIDRITWPLLVICVAVLTWLILR